ncbi:MAG: DUF488 domain-containing protein [Armatimonadetes bacterium]|nr:DUF488 domain-containing protein [Armatimonadota bacterium]MDE2206374.1 DUF488 domain-containing protein [Armatimonadota bacterium]
MPTPTHVFTIGHSDRTIEAFLSLLQDHAVELLVDVRTVPRSRHNPQFNADALSESLRAAAIGYLAAPDLGGWRRPAPDSPNMGWRNVSFRGYADAMMTPGFDASLRAMLEQVGSRRSALVCSEAVPWRCHRSLIADALTVRGITVEHIIGPLKPQLHVLRSFAHVDGTTITYPCDGSDATESHPG